MRAVDFDTFSKILNRPGGFREPFDIEEYIRGFQVFDKDRSGFVGKGQIKYILTNLGEKMSEEEVEELFKSTVDASNNEVDYRGESYCLFLGAVMRSLRRICGCSCGCGCGCGPQEMACVRSAADQTVCFGTHKMLTLQQNSSRRSRRTKPLHTFPLHPSPWRRREGAPEHRLSGLPPGQLSSHLHHLHHHQSTPERTLPPAATHPCRHDPSKRCMHAPRNNARCGPSWLLLTLTLSHTIKAFISRGSYCSSFLFLGGWQTSGTGVGNERIVADRQTDGRAGGRAGRLIASPRLVAGQRNASLNVN